VATAADVLLQVHGIIRRASTFNTHRIDHLYENPMSHKEGGMCCVYNTKLNLDSLSFVDFS